MVMEVVKGATSKSNGNTSPAPRSNHAGVSYYRVKNRQLIALVVDNDHVCNTLERGLLQAHGVHSVGVGNGYDALYLIQTGSFFDLIVVDQHMPHMLGSELISWIRYYGIESKVIGLSTADDGDRAEMMDAGADAFALKQRFDQVLPPILLELDRFV